MEERRKLEAQRTGLKEKIATIRNAILNYSTYLNDLIRQLNEEINGCKRKENHLVAFFEEYKVRMLSCSP